MVFASSSANFLYREQFAPFIGTQSSGQIYRDTKLIAFIGTVQKHMPTPTQTAT
jgi:hypothetical protein